MAGIDSVARQALSGVAAGITGVVRDAAARTGVDFSYLLSQARVESGLNPTAQAKTSSARGLYQFTNSTWLETVRKHGADHGLGWAADAIESGAAPAGSAVRATILSLRDNAEAAALMAGEFARDNGAALEARLGRAAGATDLYMAHFLGAGGAATFLDVLARAPGAVAAAVVPAAAAANRSVFYGAGGVPRTVAEVYARFEGKIEGQGAGVAVAAAVASGVDRPLSPLGARAPSRPLPQGESEGLSRGEVVPPAGSNVPVSQARLAYLLLAELGG